MKNRKFWNIEANAFLILRSVDFDVIGKKSLIEHDLKLLREECETVKGLNNRQAILDCLAEFEPATFFEACKLIVDSTGGKHHLNYQLILSIESKFAKNC
jgi:hypothetical protein